MNPFNYTYGSLYSHQKYVIKRVNTVPDTTKKILYTVSFNFCDVILRRVWVSRLFRGVRSTDAPLLSPVRMRAQRYISRVPGSSTVNRTLKVNQPCNNNVRL